VLALTAGTLVIFWLAHVYAEALSDHLKGSTRLSLAPITRAMARERPMLVGPLPSLPGGAPARDARSARR
jgi:hypothetical protein